MKHIRYVFIIGLLAVMIMAFTACGGNNNTPAPSPTPTANQTVTATTPTPEPTPPPATPEPTPEPEPEIQAQQEMLTSEEYLEEINELIDAFEELFEVVFDLIDWLEEIETDEEFMEWIDSFEIILEAIDIALEELDYATAYVPEEHLESHLLIIGAITLYFDALLELDTALASAIMGDEEAMWARIDGFAINLAAALAVWDEALFGPMTHAPILMGTWAWEEMPEWVWIFNEDGTGSSGTPDSMEDFVWETSDVFPWMNSVIGELWVNTGLFLEHWQFAVDVEELPHILWLSSLQQEGIEFYYIRQ